MNPIRREVLTWNEIDRLIDHLLPQLEGEFDSMLMITRGGIIPGGMMAEAMKINYIFTAAVDFPSQMEAEKRKLLAWPQFFQFPEDNLLRGKRILVIDPQGVVFVSNRPDWLFHTIWKLTPEQARDAMVLMGQAFQNNQGSLENNRSTLEYLGIILIDIPISYGHQFDLGSFGKLGIGGSLKIIQARTFIGESQIVQVKDSGDIVKNMTDHQFLRAMRAEGVSAAGPGGSVILPCDGRIERKACSSKRFSMVPESPGETDFSVRLNPVTNPAAPCSRMPISRSSLSPGSPPGRDAGRRS